MAVYEYQALTQAGKRVKNIIDADTPAAARQRLREQQLYPTEVTEVASHSAEKSGFRGGGRVSTRDLSLMTRQLAVLLQAGMPLVESLTALLDQTSRARLRKAIYDVRDKVKSGSRLGDSFAAHPKIFSPLFVNMVRAGEASGTLEGVLLRLADILEHQGKLQNRVLSTLAYPAFMVVFAIGIISFLMLFIVPRITQVFEKQGQELPNITKALIGTTDFIASYWYLIIGSVIGALALWRFWVSRPEGRLAWDKFTLALPLVGDLLLKMICARFSRTLGTMLQSGLTMMKALEVVSTVLQNRHIEKTMQEIKAGVRRGRDLAIPLKQSNVFPPMLISMVELGQRSGELESMLIKVAETYDDDVEITVDALVSLLEPIIIIVMGLFVGMLVLAILLPILNMSSNI